MKRYLSLLAFLLVSFTFVAAQCNGGNNGNGNGYGNNGNGNGNGNNGNGNNGNGYGNGNGNNGNNAWANTNWPQWLIHWLENGGQIPPLLAADVIWEARAWGMQNFNLTYPQMLQKYAQGSLTLEYISTAPPSLTFRVGYGVGDILIIDSY